MSREDLNQDDMIVRKRPISRRPAEEEINREPAGGRTGNMTRSIRQAKAQAQAREAEEAANSGYRPARRPAASEEGTSRPVRRPAASGEGTARPVRRSTAPEERMSRPVRRPAAPEEGTARPTRRPTAPEEGMSRPVRRSAAPEEGMSRPIRRSAAPEEGTPRPARRSAAPEQGTARRTTQEPPRPPRKSNHGFQKTLGIILMVAAVIVIAAIFILKGGAGVRTIKAATTDLNAYYNLEEGEARLVFNGVTHELKGYVSDGEFYAPYELVQNQLNNRIYYDQGEQILLYTQDNETIEIPLGANTYTRDGATVENGSSVVVMNGDTPYISMTFVQAFTAIGYSTFTDPNRLVILTDGTTLPCAAAKSTEVKESADNGAINMTVLEKDEPVWILEQGEKWCHIMSQQGIAGYVKTKKLKEFEDTTYHYETAEAEFHSIHRDHEIRMAWHQVTGMAGNDTLGSMTAGTAINTVAPTWFFLTDTAGNIASLASSDYVAEAHASGMEVWAVVNDFDGEYLYGGPNSAEATYSLLSSTSARRNLERNVLSEALEAGVDGINVDFEKVNEECGSHYIQFIRELSVLCGQNNLVLSVDTYVPSAWTVQYHREEQNLYADYVVIMAYDENGSWSNEIGPNSSLNYVEDAIADTKKTVDAEKIIIGIPFYTRLWWESSDPAEAAAQGFSCTTVTMQEQEYTLATREYDSVWDEERGTNCITYDADGSHYTMWVEDAASLKLKLDAIRDGGLAGYSAWKLGQETSDVWSILGQ